MALLVGATVVTLALLFAVCAMFKVDNAVRAEMVPAALGMPGLIVTIYTASQAKVS